MPTNLLHTDNILAMFDEAFGKGAPRAVKVKHTVPAKKVAQTETSRILSFLAHNSIWKPVGIVYQTVEQECLCCGELTETLGNILIRHQHKFQPTTFWCTVLPDSTKHQYLPKEFISFPRQVEHCPQCLRLEFNSCDYPAKFPHQLSLFTHDCTYEGAAA